MDKPSIQQRLDALPAHVKESPEYAAFLFYLKAMTSSPPYKARPATKCPTCR